MSLSSIREYDLFTNTIIRTNKDSTTSTSKSTRTSDDSVKHEKVQKSEIDTGFVNELNQIHGSKLKNKIEDQLDIRKTEPKTQTKPGTESKPSTVSSAPRPNPFPESLGRWETFLGKHTTLQKIHDYFSSNISITASDYDNLTLSPDNRLIKLFLAGKLNKTATIAVYDRVINAYGNNSDLNERIAGTAILSSAVKSFGKGKNHEQLRHYLDNKLLTVVKFGKLDPSIPKLRQVEGWILTQLWGKDLEKMPANLAKSLSFEHQQFFDGDPIDSIGKPDMVARALKETEVSLIRERDFNTFSKEVDKSLQDENHIGLFDFPEDAVHEILTTKDIDRALHLIDIAYDHYYDDDSETIQDNEYRTTIDNLKEIARFDRSVDYLLVALCRHELLEAVKYYKKEQKWNVSPNLHIREDKLFKALSTNFPWTNKAELDLVFDVLEEKGYNKIIEQKFVHNALAPKDETSSLLEKIKNKLKPT